MLDFFLNSFYSWQKAPNLSVLLIKYLKNTRRYTSYEKTVSIGLSMAILATSAITGFAQENNHKEYTTQPNKHYLNHESNQIQSVEFISMKAPSTIENMVKTYTESTIKVTYKN